MEFRNLYNYKPTFSKRDVEKGLVLPTKMTPELAEYLGIVVGDGYVCRTRNRKTGKMTYNIEISGNINSDLKYHKECIIPLYKRIFNVDVKISKRPKDSIIRIIICSKSLVELIIGLGIKSPKDSIMIPSCVLNTKKFWIPFLRGLFDTDGSLSLKKRYREFHYYPVISLKQKSRHIIEQVVDILQQLGFKVNAQYDIIRVDKRGFTTKGSRLFLNGIANLKLWMDTIRFNNPKNIIKAEKCFKIYGAGGSFRLPVKWDD